ncbi:Hsp20/alpha crystallin family protein [Synechococcus sp. LA31]|uniref:Hsp20/alpha crystallin family protein n=1 Tax=Synechococcus sp. LA31 TaxID=2741953 RepID=UPI00202862EE|nr:Hsp20/alpha crystallin family protein [Synechococcus sp. LA31]
MKAIHNLKLPTNLPGGIPMSLTKWEPLTDIEAIVDRAFNWPPLRLGTSMALAELGPRVDICESDGTYLFKADIPGMNKEDLIVSIADDMLTIQGERKRESEETRPHFHRVERSYGSFSRSFSLPDDADPKTVHAHCEKGELTVSIAKRAGTKETKPITVPVD